jgi:hypothetical protein
MTGQRTPRICWTLLALLACSGTTVKPSGPRAPSVHTPKAPDESVTLYDLHHTGKSDVWEYSVAVPDATGKPQPRLVRREIDMNGDGKVDLATLFDDKGEPAKEALDLDFDGRVDQVNVYENGRIARKERDTDADGRPDVTEFFEKGRKVRVERDTNHDGHVDTWEEYENGKLVRTGEDTDGDGKPDRWVTPPDAAAP